VESLPGNVRPWVQIPLGAEGVLVELYLQRFNRYFFVEKKKGEAFWKGGWHMRRTSPVRQLGVSVEAQLSTCRAPECELQEQWGQKSGGARPWKSHGGLGPWPSMQLGASGKILTGELYDSICILENELWLLQSRHSFVSGWWKDWKPAVTGKVKIGRPGLGRGISEGILRRGDHLGCVPQT
jgi:hypothetical protein